MSFRVKYRGGIKTNRRLHNLFCRECGAKLKDQLIEGDDFPTCKCGSTMEIDFEVKTDGKFRGLDHHGKWTTEMRPIWKECTDPATYGEHIPESAREGDFWP